MAFIKRLKPKQFALWGGFVLIAILFAVWAVLFVLHFAPAQKTQHTIQTQHTTHTTQTKAQTITLAPKFSLTDENGQIVSETDYGASYKLIYFGFTYCPDVCPLQLQIISQALDRLGAQAAHITPLFISLDSARDTPAILKDYTNHFHPRLIGLSGTNAQIKAAAQSFKIYFNKIADESSQAGYTIDHSSIVYLLAPNNHVVRYFTARDTDETIAQDLRQALRNTLP